MTWGQVVCYASLHSEPASAMGLPILWSPWGNQGIARCQEMPVEYIPQHKLTLVSSKVTGFHCVWSFVGWFIVYQDGNYLYPGQYNQAYCLSKIEWCHLWDRNIGKTQYIPGKQVLVRSWLWKTNKQSISWKGNSPWDLFQLAFFIQRTLSSYIRFWQMVDWMGLSYENSRYLFEVGHQNSTTYKLVSFLFQSTQTFSK